MLCLLQELEASLKQYQEKQTKLVKTVKAARSRIQELNAEKDQVNIYADLVKYSH